MPFGGLLTASIAAPMVGGIIGNIASSGDRRRAQEAYEQALAEIKAFGHPPDIAREIILRNFNQVGVLTPELEEAVAIEAPQVAAIQTDPNLRKAQLSALDLLGRKAKGVSTEEQIDLALMRGQINRDVEAKRQQMLQSFQQRGIAGAGAEIASQLQTASAGEAQAQEEALKLQAQARRSTLEAATQYGSLAGQQRQQEFGEAQTKAEASDRATMARFNEAVGRQQRNVATRMGVQQQNLATRQRVAEQNVAQQNAELQRQRAAEERRYQLQMQRAEMLANAYQQRGGQYQKQAQQTAGMYSELGSGLGDAGLAFGMYGHKQGWWDDKPKPKKQG